MSRFMDTGCRLPGKDCSEKWTRRSFRFWTTCGWMLCLLLNLGWSMGDVAGLAAETEKKKPADTDKVPTTITSQTMTVSNHENKAIFDGSVVLTRGPLVVYSDHMVVSFYASHDGPSGDKSGDSKKVSKKNSGGTAGPGQGRDAAPSVSDRSIRMVEATGRVKIEKEDGHATCQTAVYYEDEKKIVLTGDPVAWQKGTRVSGKRITMYLDEDRSLVEGNSQVTIEGEGGGKR
ncbi:MAG: hypothetical protein DCC63_09480 [Nitrospira sp.]|nr:MAG: hypothetical protein DCC63_09480 [Nitrospira sp.]